MKKYIGLIALFSVGIIIYFVFTRKLKNPSTFTFYKSRAITWETVISSPHSRDNQTVKIKAI